MVSATHPLQSHARSTAALLVLASLVSAGCTTIGRRVGEPIPAATPGIMGSLLLAISRAIGETMIVVMAAGLAANLTANPFEAVTTMTVQIVTLLTGDQEFERRDIEMGVSNGIFVEVTSGITKDDKIKVWNQLKAPISGGGF